MVMASLINTAMVFLCSEFNIIVFFETAVINFATCSEVELKIVSGLRFHCSRNMITSLTEC